MKTWRQALRILAAAAAGLGAAGVAHAEVD